MELIISYSGFSFDVKCKP